jgi:hypothetical protein
MVKRRRDGDAKEAIISYFQRFPSVPNWVAAKRLGMTVGHIRKERAALMLPGSNGQHAILREGQLSSDPSVIEWLADRAAQIGSDATVLDAVRQVLEEASKQSRNPETSR